MLWLIRFFDRVSRIIKFFFHFFVFFAQNIIDYDRRQWQKRFAVYSIIEFHANSKNRSRWVTLAARDFNAIEIGSEARSPISAELLNPMRLILDIIRYKVSINKKSNFNYYIFRFAKFFTIIIYFLYDLDCYLILLRRSILKEVLLSRKICLHICI